MLVAILIFLAHFNISRAYALVYRGMMIAIPAVEWKPLGGMPLAELAALLKELASRARLSTYQRHRRGPKKPQPKRPHSKDKPHVSTARLIANRLKKKRSP